MRILEDLTMAQELEVEYNNLSMEEEVRIIEVMVAGAQEETR